MSPWELFISALWFCLSGRMWLYASTPIILFMGYLLGAGHIGGLTNRWDWYTRRNWIGKTITTIVLVVLAISILPFMLKMDVVVIVLIGVIAVGGWFLFVTRRDLNAIKRASNHTIVHETTHS